MSNQSEEFHELLNDPNFPKILLKGEGAEERLCEEFLAHPAQFARHILGVLPLTQKSAWDTQEGQKILRGLSTTKEEVLKWV
jgi:hypothetical protein